VGDVKDIKVIYVTNTLSLKNVFRKHLSDIGVDFLILDGDLETLFKIKEFCPNVVIIDPFIDGAMSAVSLIRLIFDRKIPAMITIPPRKWDGIHRFQNVGIVHTVPLYCDIERLKEDIRKAAEVGKAIFPQEEKVELELLEA